MQEAVKTLSLLKSLGNEITSHVQMDQFVLKALEGVTQVMGADLALLYLRQDNELVLKGVYPMDAGFDSIGTTVERVGECLCGLAGNGEIIFSSDIHSDPRCVLDECKNAGIKSLAALPLIVQGKVLGVLSLASINQRDFNRQSDFLEAVATQIAVALQNSILYETMAKQVEELERAIDVRQRMASKLKASEESLQKQLIELEHLYDTSPLGLCFLDTDLRFMRINAEMAAINGKSASDHLGKTLAEALPELADQVTTLCKQVIETGDPVLNIEVRGMTKTDPAEPHDWLASYYPVKDNIGRLVGIGAVVQDITDRKKAERELKLSEERYQIVSGLTSDYAYAYRVAEDGSLAIDWVTGALKRISGYTKEEIQARGGWESLIYPDDMSIPMKQFKALFNNEATEVEYRIVTKTGQIRWMRDYARPVMDDARENLKYIFGAVQDISERKEAERALQVSEESYRELVENINDAIFLADKEGKLIYISPAIEKISDYHPANLIGRMLQDFIHPEDHTSIKEHFKQLMHGIIIPREYRIVTKSGQTRWVRISSNPVMKDQKVIQIRGVLTDIDAAKKIEVENTRLQEQLQQSQKMEAIGTLAGGIAHDFNNILSAVIGYTEMAMVEAEEGTAQHQNLMEVFRAGGRAKDLVKQILTFSRQNKKETQPVQIKLIAKEVIKFMRASLPSTIRIQQSIDTDALIMADPTQVYQIILNLCTNAGYAMAENGGLLEVKLADIQVAADMSATHPDLKPGPYIQVTVSDTGHGISKPILKRIFDPYFTTKDKDKGTGMGLSVVHGIVGSYGGSISVTSEPDKGSIFTVYFPSIDWSEESQPQPQVDIETGTEHILLVDDEEALVRIGKKTLESLGYVVTAKTSSLDALELFKTKGGRFDLVITDTTMPNMAGDKLAQEMLRINPKIPIIICSGYSSHIDQQKAFELGIRAFITKPILRNEIARAVRNVLDGDKTS